MKARCMISRRSFAVPPWALSATLSSRESRRFWHSFGFGIVNGEWNLFVLRVRLERSLQHWMDLFALEGAAPHGLHCPPGTAVAIEFARLNRQPGVRSAFVALDDIDRQIERGFEKFGNV